MATQQPMPIRVRRWQNPAPSLPLPWNGDGDELLLRLWKRPSSPLPCDGNGDGDGDGNGDRARPLQCDSELPPSNPPPVVPPIYGQISPTYSPHPTLPTMPRSKQEPDRLLDSEKSIFHYFGISNYGTALVTITSVHCKLYVFLLPYAEDGSVLKKFSLKNKNKQNKSTQPKK